MPGWYECMQIDNQICTNSYSLLPYSCAIRCYSTQLTDCSYCPIYQWLVGQMSKKKFKHQLHQIFRTVYLIASSFNSAKALAEFVSTFSQIPTFDSFLHRFNPKSNELLYQMLYERCTTGCSKFPFSQF